MQTDTPTLFSLLKPHCVALSEVALDFQRTNSPSHLLQVRLESLLTALRAISESRSSEFNSKLAEYVFFPLSHVFRQSQSAPTRLLQSSLQCLSILLQIGWKGHIAPDLAFQLIILLSLFADGKSDASGRRGDSEDLQVEAFGCLRHVLEALRASPTERQALTDFKNIPALARMATVVLDGISQSHSTQTSLVALDLLRDFIDIVEDREVLASFLPGITSCLTQVATPNTQTRRSFKVLQSSLKSLTLLFERVVADKYDFPRNKTIKQHIAGEDRITLDIAWLTATSAQIKLALANIIRLRTHSRMEVRAALLELCRAILEDISVHLSECIPLTVDAFIELIHLDNTETGRAELLRLTRQNLIVGEAVKSGLYDRFISLPRLILSNDHTVKLKVANYIETSFPILTDTNMGLTSLTPLISSSLLESVTGLVERPKHVLLTNAPSSESQEDSASLYDFDARMRLSFPEILTASQSNNDNERMLAAIIRNSLPGLDVHRLLKESLKHFVNETPNARIACYWLSLSILRVRFLEQDDMRSFLRIADTSKDELDLCEDLFVESLSILSQSSVTDESDWRLQALALEGLAFHASTLGEAFRPELADALYPTLHLLGAGNPLLRQHAMIALNIISKACNYQNAQELIIENVDYLVNGVSVRLNMFDISPEAPQVLLMLIKLCGPSLLPYLDDVTDNIFDGLEHFHGYPTLVELLFSVLRAMVEEGVKSAGLAITSDKQKVRKRHRVDEQEPLRIEGVIAEFGRKAAERGNDDLSVGSSKAPQEPWSKLRQDQDDPKVNGPHHQRSSDSEQGAIDAPDKGPPLSRNYHLLHRITTLTQHHLPSSSSSIRSSLLSLLTTALPYLSAHEDTFLPLVHTLWPVLVPRLADREAFVISGVLDVMGAMCEGAGDFMRGRVAEIWPEVRKIYRLTTRKPKPSSERPHDGQDQVAARAAKEPSLLIGNGDLSLMAGAPVTSPLAMLPTAQEESFTLVSSTRQPPVQGSQDSHEYTPTTVRMIRHALERFLINLIQNVNVTAMIFDEILREMLYIALMDGNRKDVRRALAQANADALWVVLEQARRREKVGKTTRP